VPGGGPERTIGSWRPARQSCDTGSGIFAKARIGAVPHDRMVTSRLPIFPGVTVAATRRDPIPDHGSCRRAIKA